MVCPAGACTSSWPTGNPAWQSHAHSIARSPFRAAARPQQEAQEALEYALAHCHRAAARNKALVLKYLVPASAGAGGLRWQEGNNGRMGGCCKRGCKSGRRPCSPACRRPPHCRLQVQLLLGRLPTPALIAAHGLQQYEPIIAAMRRCARRQPAAGSGLRGACYPIPLYGFVRLACCTSNCLDSCAVPVA